MRKFQEMAIQVWSDLDSDELPDLPHCSDSEKDDCDETLSALNEVPPEGEDAEGPQDAMMQARKAQSDGEHVIPLGYNPETGEVYHNQMADPTVRELNNEY